MSGESPTEIRYRPMQCQFLRKEVWAILARQADGSWRIVNCLDKNESCFHLDCAFTTDSGSWPYEARPSPFDVGA